MFTVSVGPMSLHNDPSSRHEPQDWPREDPELKDYTSPPDECIVTEAIDNGWRGDGDFAWKEWKRDGYVTAVVGIADVGSQTRCYE